MYASEGVQLTWQQGRANVEGKEGYVRLLSALDRPKWHQENDPDADLADLAAVLAQGIAKAHAFWNGNKRTAEMAMVSFLERNGCELRVGEETLKEWILDITEKRGGESAARELAGRIRRRWVRKPMARPTFPSLREIIQGVLRERYEK